MPDGYQLFSIVMAYLPMRFFWDFLRVPKHMKGGDIRYWGLTPAQYFSVIVFVGLAVWFVRKKIKKQMKSNN